MTHRVRGAILGILVCGLMHTAIAAVPTLINYQGVLTDAGNAPLSGTFDVAFSIYDAAGGPDPALWSEVQTVVTDPEGRFNVLLGSVTPIDASVFSGDARYLGITVESDPELSPRSRLASLPFAFQSDRLQGHAASDFIKVDDSTLIVDSTNNTVRMGTEFNTGAGERLYVGYNNPSGTDNLGAQVRVRNPGSGSSTGLRVSAGDPVEGTGDAYGVIGVATSGSLAKAWGVSGLAEGPGDCRAIFGFAGDDSLTYSGYFLGNRVQIASNSSDVPAPRAAIGERWRDNAIVAWGNVAADGTIEQAFRVDAITHTQGSGVYVIDLAIIASENDPNKLVMVANAEVDAIPTSAATARHIYVDQITGDGGSFRVYVIDGTYAAADNEFTFIVTAR